MGGPSLEGVDLVGSDIDWRKERVPARTLGPKGGRFGGVSHRLEKGTSAREDAGPQRGWIVRTHIGWEGKRNRCPFSLEYAF